MIVLFRHGETVYNYERRLQGWSDSALTCEGVQQIHRVSKHFVDNYMDNSKTILICSDLLRSVFSANILNSYLEMQTVIPCKSLREQSWGLWETKCIDEKEVQRMLRIRNQHYHIYTPDGGESINNLFMRVQHFIATNGIAELGTYQTILIHSHCNTIKALIHCFTGSSLDKDPDHETYYIINNKSYEEVIV